MSIPITAEYFDGKLNDIRSALQRMTDEVPFLLMPIKIETRFMKVEKPIGGVNTGQLEGILGELGQIAAELASGIPSSFSTSRLRRKYDGVRNDIVEVRRQINGLPIISRKQKSWVQELGQMITAEGSAIVAALRARSGLSGTASKLSGEFNALNNAIANIKIHPDYTFAVGREVVDQFRKLQNQLNNINNGKLPYTNIKNKRRLYEFVEKTYAGIEHFYRLQEDKYEGVKAMHTSQLSRIRSLHNGIRRAVKQLPDTLGSIHKDSSWKKFVGKMAEDANTKLPPLFNQFEQRDLKKFEFATTLKKSSAGELYLKGVKTLIELSKFNNAENQKYHQVKTSKAAIKNKIDSLQKTANQAIEAFPQQVEVFQELWGDINKAFESYKTKISSLGDLNISQQFGVTQSVNYVSQTAQTALLPITGNTVRSFSFVTNQQINNSWAFTSGALSALQQINQSLPDFSRNQASQLLTQMQHLNRQFAIAARDNTVLNKENFQQMEAQVIQLEANVETVPVEQRNDYLLELGKMKNYLGAYDIWDRPDFLHPDWGPVFVTPTITVNELWVRIFPDDIFLDTHEEALTEEEKKDGKDFWLSYWVAGTDYDLQLGAWRYLHESYGPQRAAWIAKQMDPRPSNSQRFDRNGYGKTPSLRLIQGLDQMIAINTMIKEALGPEEESRPATTIVRALETADILKKFENVYRKIRSINIDQAYFLQKMWDQFRIAASYLDQINSTIVIRDLRPRDLQAYWASTLEIFTQISNEIRQIQPQTTAQMIDRYRRRINFNLVERAIGESKPEQWDKAPQAKGLPHRFVVLTKEGDQFKHIVVSEAVDQELKLGFDPKYFNQPDEEIEKIFEFDEAGKMIINDDIRWMIDYQEALSKGMAVTIPLTLEEAEAGFDKLLVLGVREEQNSANVLEDLFRNHQYAPDGMGFLQIGAPTNNTKKQPSDFKNLESDAELSFRLALGLPLYEPVSSPSSASYEQRETALLNKPDGQRLAEALGISPNFFEHIQGSERTQISNAIAFNKAIWHATFGFYMEEMWDTVFTYDNIDRTREFFNQYCLGRGMLPSLRIGTQPYGILPTTAFSRMKFRRGRSREETIDTQNLPNVTRRQLTRPMTSSLNSLLQVRYDARLTRFLLDLNKTWTKLRNENKVKHLHNIQDVDNPQEHFMQMLGLHATSVEHYYRFGINVASRAWTNALILPLILFNFEETDDYGPNNLFLKYAKHVLDGRFDNAFDFPDEVANPGPDLTLAEITRAFHQFKEAGLFKWRFFAQDARFNTNMISTKALSEKDRLEHLANTDKNYIQWLLDQNLFHILGSTEPSQIRSTKALFLMLRQSLLMAYRSAAMGILELEDFFEEPYRKFIGSANNYKVYAGQANEFNVATKWTYLYRELGDLDDLDFQNYNGKRFYQHFRNRSALNRAMAEYLYPLEPNPLIQSYSRRSTHEPFFNQIREVRTAFSKLATLPTQELDRLLHEHLDLNSYRLDAWILGLANRKLQTQRTSRPGRIYLGAYGWVEDLRRGGTREPAETVPEGLYETGERDIFTDEDNQGFIHAPSLDHAMTAAILRSGYHSNSASEDIGNQMAVNLSSRRVRMALNLVQGIQNGLDIGGILGFQMERGLHEKYLEDPVLELDRYILPLRIAYPLQIPIEDTAVDTNEKFHTNVINGKTILDEVQAVVDSQSLPRHWSTYLVLTRNNFLRCPTKIVKAVTGYNTYAALVGAGLPSGTRNRLTRHLRAVCKEVDRMADAFDALGDLAISESVYQVVQGNYARVGSLLQALAEGRAPSEFQVTNTPRTGVVINQRVILNIDRTVSAKPAGWTADLTPRAQAEPSVNKWLGEILGDPADIRCLATYKIGEEEFDTSISLEDLAIHPIDILYMLGENPEKGGSELSRRIAYFVRANFSLPADTHIQLRFTERDPDWDAATEDIRSFYEIEPLLKQLRNLLADSRGASAEDLKNPEQEPDTDNPGEHNLADLDTRVRNALQALRDPTNSLNTWLGNIDKLTPALTDSQLGEIEAFLHTAGAYGIANGIPDNMQGLADNAMRQFYDHTQSVVQLAKNKVATPGPPQDLPRPILVLDEGIQALETADWWATIDAGDPAYADDHIAAIAKFMELAEEFGIAGAGLPDNGYIQGMISATYHQAKGGLAKSKERLGPVTALEAKADNNELATIRRVEALVEISKQLFGKSFLILPCYRPRNLKTMIKQQHELPADQQLTRNAMIPVPLVMEDWLNCIADVRPKMYALQMAGVLKEAFGEDPWSILPAQTPYQDGDYWVGRSYPGNLFKLEEDKLSLVLINPEKLTSGSTTSNEVGIVIDEWVEIIPNEQETTGITFNYDQPNAKPPQNILLAVTPAQTRRWDWDDLVYTLLETLELAKNRAVEPEHLEQSKLAQALPAIVAEAALSSSTSRNQVLYQVFNNFQAILFQQEE